MSKIYIAFYDDEEGGSRENWNTFHTPWVASTTREGALKLAREKIAADIAESIKYEFDIDLSTVDRSTLDNEVLDEIEYAEGRMHIEIQEGELE